MALLRIKYRAPPIEPEFSSPKEGASLSLAKKVKPIEEDPYAGIKKISHQETIFLSNHTQLKRTEVLVVSDELKYREDHYPTIHERIIKQKEWSSMQLREAKLANEREKLKKMMMKKLEKAKKIDVNDENKSVDSTISEGDLEEDGDEEDEELEEITADEQKDISDNFALELLEIKEKKVLATRNTDIYHNKITKYQIRKMAIRLLFKLVGKNQKELTEVLPWLLVGRKEVSSNIQLLTKHGITHILNATPDLPNHFPNNFVYQRIPIKDSIDSNIGSKFDTAINFIQRVEDCKGRIFVHCTVGASRAPTFVLAYLVYKKGLTLFDAYNYLTTIRPVVSPNKHFLFQLAMLEVQTTNTCSVYYHRDWRFYEFNIFRSEKVEERQSKGIYQTVFDLFDEKKDEEMIS